MSLLAANRGNGRDQGRRVAASEVHRWVNGLGFDLSLLVTESSRHGMAEDYYSDSAAEHLLLEL